LLPVAAHAGAAFPAVECAARHTAGFHDYVGGEEVYEASMFHPGRFRLSTNDFLTTHLAGDASVELYLTMTDAGGEATELECRMVRGAGASEGYSCVNIPPSELLLINAETLRFTRTSVGGWTFAGATQDHNGDSIFVEYGECKAPAPPAG
jgi:hypothetical protein